MYKEKHYGTRFHYHNNSRHGSHLVPRGNRLYICGDPRCKFIKLIDGKCIVPGRISKKKFRSKWNIKY